MKIVGIWADSPQEMNCSDYNILMVSRAVNKLKGEHSYLPFYMDDFVNNLPECEKACLESDLIIVERNLFGDTLTRMQYWKSRNKAVAVIFDDSYDKMHPENMSYPFWALSKVKGKNDKGVELEYDFRPKPIEQFKWGLRMAKGIITPSIVLSDDWGEYAQTYRTYNYLDMERYPIIPNPLFPHDDIVIGWSGSMSHLYSFTNSGIIPAIKNVLHKYKNVRLMITGDKRVYDKFEISKKRRLYSPFVPPDKWGALVKSLDIGLAPLSGEFDRRRSWIKVLEYMILKVPWIASNLETYHELGEYGRLVENSVENWTNALSETIENIEEARALANGKAYEFALTQSHDNNVTKNLAIYQHIINSEYKT